MSFEIFKSFYSEEEAVQLMTILSEKGVDCKLEKRRQILDKVIVGDGNEPEIYLKVRQSDFVRANQVIDETVANNLSELDRDYYLYSFTKNELLEIIQKPDEWSNQDFIIAKKILADLGQALTEKEINSIKSTRISELSQPEQESSSWIFLGYIFAFFLPLVGLFLGLTFNTTKKMLPDGNKVLVYGSKTRAHGATILVISIIILSLRILGIVSVRWWNGAEWWLNGG
jgi:hypothetical protein